jgi:hypothetical protein
MEWSGLDTDTCSKARIAAALAAMGAPPMMNLAAAEAAGVSVEDVQAILVAAARDA